MTQDVFRNIHILIAGGKPGNARLLQTILSQVGVKSIAIAQDTRRALDLLGSRKFNVVFCDEGIGPLDAIAFCATLRRSAESRNPQLPIIVVSDGPHRSDIEEARDSGVNDFIVRPVSTDTVRRKLTAVLVTPKPFIQSDGFRGPDRRHKRDRRASKSSALASGSARDRRKLRHSRRSTDAKLQPQS